MKRVAVGFSIGLVGVALVAVMMCFPGGRSETREPIRALWVTRFDYDAREDVEQIVRNVAEAGFTDLFFQIRGNATAFYRSALEPWAYELSGGELARLGHDPGWDPLQAAIDEADEYGLRLHAYMNVLPGWKGLEDPPESAGQLWSTHRDWFMVDSLGERMRPTLGWYAFINPVLPEVREHLRGIVNELCRYDVAGVHLDYIRYPHDYADVALQHYPEATKAELHAHADFSYDPVSQAELFERYGWGATKQQIGNFRRESVTRVVRDISYVMQRDKPDACVLSASVMGDPVHGRNMAYQDSGHWVRGGLVDWAVQMNYGTKTFSRNLARMRKVTGRKGFGSSVVVGLYCKNGIEELLKQLKQVEDSGARGYALFSYTYLFDEDHRPSPKGQHLMDALNR